MDIRTISEEDEDVEVTQEELLFHSDVRENIVSVPAECLRNSVLSQKAQVGQLC